MIRFVHLPFAFLAALLGATMLLAGACSSGSDASSPQSIELGGNQQQQPRYMGFQQQPAVAKPDAVLTDTSGQPFDVRKETEDYLTLIYVGYTNCPDACPAHMSTIAAALKRLPQDAQDRIKVLFVTSDPERDTPQVLRTWLDHFDPRFIGLTGSPDQLDDFQRSIGMNPATKEDLGNGNYGVSHAAYVLAFTNDNLAHLIYPLGVTEDSWVHDLQLLAAEGWNPDGSSAAASPTPTPPGASVTVDDLTISNARAIATEDPVGVVYFALTNKGGDDTLQSVHASVGTGAELHQTVTQGATSMMEPLPGGLDISSGETRELEPGGYHLMLMGLNAPLKEGSTVGLDLQFAHRGAVHLDVPVVAR